jgi:hypothetical protein
MKRSDLSDEFYGALRRHAIAERFELQVAYWTNYRSIRS